MNEVNVLRLMPSLEGEEMMFVQGLIRDMTETQAMTFAGSYNVRRKDPQTILLVTLLGFIGVAGVQRFLLGQIGLGLLYLFTAGFCWIGTIIDLVCHRRLAFDYNTRIAQQLAVMARATN